MIQDIFPHSFVNSYVAGQVITDHSYIFVFDGNNLLLKQDGDKVSLPRKQDFLECPNEGTFLFSLNGQSCFWLQGSPKQKPDEHLDYHEIRFLHTIAEREIDLLSGVALHLKNWYEQHHFCGKCGGHTHHKEDERALVCSKCEHIVFPTISPAMIVAVICGDHILLAHGVNFREGLFSLVAGYVDVGESVEQTIIREVQEEVGVSVSDVRYYSSQPWPFTGSLMIGFIARVDELQAITIDPKEIAEANWYHRSKLPNYPSDRSIAGEIIDKFQKGEL